MRISPTHRFRSRRFLNLNRHSAGASGDHRGNVRRSATFGSINLLGYFLASHLVFRRLSHSVKLVLATGCGLMLFCVSTEALGQDEPDAKAKEEDRMRIGIIGLDTSHVIAFTKLFNDSEAKGDLAQMQVIAAFPGGSPDIASSRDRIEGYTKQLSEMGIEIVDSIGELLQKVDAVLLESVDGRKHLAQVAPVFESGKPVFIDKPLSADLPDAIAIDLLARLRGARWFSSSSLRFSPSILKFRENAEWKNKVNGATAWSPCALEPTHTDLYWYGVHGVETLYTAMGVGCHAVYRVHDPKCDVVVGIWDDGRVGTFRGIREGKTGYGLVVFGEKAIDLSGKYEGYAPLVEEIAAFFLGGDPPVTPEETLEIFTFMKAADVSRKTGKPVAIKSVWDDSYQQAQENVARILHE